MHELIDKVLCDPTFVWVGVFLAIMLTLAIFKKLYKLVMIIMAAFMIYVGYLYYTGEEPAEAIDDLIKKGKDVIKPLFSEILDDFFPRYIKILAKREFRPSIHEIRIEGHTSTEWNYNSTDHEAYINNMNFNPDFEDDFFSLVNPL